MSRLPRALAPALPAAAALLLLVACSSSGTPASDPSASGSPAEGGVADAPAFSVAMPGVPGVSMVPLLAAIDALREQGYDIETPWLAESELTVEGTASGDFAFSSGTSQSTLLAMEQGAPLRWIGDRVENEWTVYGAEGVATCADLAGKRLAIHSEGAISTAMVHLWMDQTCPGTQANEVVISGSPNRYQALVAGQIDASPLELADAIQLEATQTGFTRITSFSADIPELKTTTYYGNADFMAEHPQVVKDLLAAIVTENRRIAEDPAYLADLITTYVEGFDEALLDEVAEAYSSQVMFPVNADLVPEEVEFTLKTFSDGGIIEGGLTVDDVVDDSYLTEVLAEMGTQ